MQNNIVRCPHCHNFIIIEKLNCGIFRHAMYINNGKQIDPHSSKEICDKLIKEKLIYGCVWLQWITTNDVSIVYDEDKMAGIFYSIYGINDWLFCVFFLYVFIRLLRQQ